MKKITMIALSGNKQMNSLARACDIFEPSKVYATKKMITVTIDEAKFDPVKGMDAIKQALDRQYLQVVALLCPAIDYVWYDDSVVSVSDGSKWFLLKNFLKANGVVL